MAPASLTEAVLYCKVRASMIFSVSMASVKVVSPSIMVAVVSVMTIVRGGGGGGEGGRHAKQS